jgi:hypothetical protein
MPYDIEKNLTNHPPVNSDVIGSFERVRAIAKNLAATIDGNCPDSREKSLAFTNLEQALMWAIASIARNQGESDTVRPATESRNP